MHLTLLAPVSYLCSCFVCTSSLVPTAFPEGLQGGEAVPSLLHNDGEVLTSCLQLCGHPTAKPWWYAVVSQDARTARGKLLHVASGADIESGNPAPMAEVGTGWPLRSLQCKPFYDSVLGSPWSPAPSDTLIPMSSSLFWTVWCPTLAAAQRGRSLFKTCWRCKLLTSKRRSYFLWLLSLGFHGGQNDLFAVAAFNRGSSYHVWRICHISQESTWNLGMVRCSLLLPVHKSSATLLQGQSGISGLISGLLCQATRQ